MNNSDGMVLEHPSFTRPLALTSAICLCILSAITITSNILLLVAIWKDPLKCFKSAATYYVVGLSLADLCTGLITEPFFAAAYFITFLEGKVVYSGALGFVYRAGVAVSGVALKYSFLVILALSWTQFVAITWPHSYKRFVTKRKVLFFMVAVFLYLVLFTSVQLLNIFKIMTFLIVDLTLNTTFLCVNLLVISVLLIVAYRKRTVSRAATYSQSTTQGKANGGGARERAIDHQFTIVSIYLAVILLLTALPHVILAYTYLFTHSTLTVKQNERIQIALRISDILLFIKVCLDPFVYAWRLPAYRKTLATMFLSRNGRSEQERMEGMRLTGHDQLSSSPKQKAQATLQA
ncbi:predicted protein [Nematostella vectensis]|uniref:G-protein coupled receptors family 1 profile domain-containing protein n=1 Tax=Nematostella vectensis TaxID=45351 RepID=A7S522_NEMVE|nr:uncharacterized protein LOC5512873 [Nematostella vectensis]EDO41129.1 predicted protein [Nematostella vectensis]|eukprot:XP_001633192.1 predicted protein [Nematostella vectensis]